MIPCSSSLHRQCGAGPILPNRTSRCCLGSRAKTLQLCRPTRLADRRQLQVKAASGVQEASYVSVPDAEPVATVIAAAPAAETPIAPEANPTTIQPPPPTQPTNTPKDPAPLDNVRSLRLWQFPPSQTPVTLLPEKNHGNLRGGLYPFTYDPVYGLPVVREVAKYSEVLRDIRMELVDEVHWFLEPHTKDPFDVDGRCLIRYKDGSVKQSVIPPSDFRIPYAMETHGVKGVKVPAEPRYVQEFADRDRFREGGVGYYDDFEHPMGLRRGPPVGPQQDDMWKLASEDTKELLVEVMREEVEEFNPFKRMNTYVQQVQAAREKAANTPVSTNGNIWVVLGPWIGCGAILLFTLALRFQRGDLVDRINIYYYQETEQKTKALKEARLSFLEEELPAIVAGGTTLEECQKRAKDLNKKLGEKLEISDVEVERTYQACKMLLQGGDIEISTDYESAERKLDAEQYADRVKAMKDGGQEQESEEDALLEFGKFNTARIRKATDPKILDVKRKLREARRKLKTTSKVQITDEIIFFDDVAGNEQAKLELMEIVDFFRKPGRYQKVGAKVPKGVLLIGPPGNGKTLMARAVAGEAGVAFVSCGASEFIEMYMGLGAARVRDLYMQARALSPCIIFIDELDAVGRQRGGGEDSNQERDMTVNQLLSEMDGFEAENTGIVVLAATNRLDVLDGALTRPGRFDRKVEVRKPDYGGRLQCLKVHLRDKPVAGDINYDELAFLTAGYSGAMLAGLCNSAAFVASREGREEITNRDMLAAMEQEAMMQTSRRVYSAERKRRFAVMEAAVSLTATLLPAIEPVKEATIIQDLKAHTGHTELWINFERARTNQWTRRYMSEQLVLMVCTRAAELMLYGADGLSSLHQRRLHAARQVVTKMLNSGFSEHPDLENIRVLGSQYMPFENRNQVVTVASDLSLSRSEGVDVDLEMERRLNDAHEAALALLRRNREALEQLVEALLEKDTLSGDEIRAIVEQYGHPDDLAIRAAEKGKVLL